MIKKQIMSDDEVKDVYKHLFECFEKYNNVLSLMAADAPIETLCLPSTTQSYLINAGIVRIYDLIGSDLTKIKGLGPVRVKQLTARLNEFIAM